MRIFPRSIRWRLQLWYGLILFLVLGAFGFTTNRLATVRQFRQIDQELQQRVSVLVAAMRPGGHPREPMELPDGERRRMPFSRPPGGEPRPDEGFRRFGPPRFELRLAPEDAVLFDRGEPSPFYYAVWMRGGRMQLFSQQAPEAIPQPARLGAGASASFRTRGTLREAYLFPAPGDCIVVGRSIKPDLAELQRWTGWLAGTGAGILVLGLTGGWWLASRAIRPVDAISSAAARISGGDLSQRINLQETESELGQLAAVLNSTFARLEDAFAQQARFTSDAAHELRTPVTVMLMQTQMALNRERSGAEYREILGACQRAAQRMRRLTESLLALARLDAGQEPLQATSIDLTATIRDCVELVRPLADERSIDLVVDLPGVTCRGDAEGLSQVFTNLLTNAIQYNHERGRVRVTAEVGPNTVAVAVLDNGPGIAPNDLPHVFDRFYRADQARTGSANAGLGLAISKAIVELHGGAIECRSQPGAGATFTVRLPMAKGGAESDSRVAVHV
jgi:signal transduction histidine kinase